MSPASKGQSVVREPQVVRNLLSPTNVAIVGASDRQGSLSRGIFAALRLCGFAGPIYPITPRVTTLWGTETCYADLAALPVPPDPVVIAAPGAAVIDTITAAGQAGARSATIFSGGFGEGGSEEGRALDA